MSTAQWSQDKTRETFSESGDDGGNRLDDALEARLLEWENLYSHPNFVTTYSDVQLPTDMTQSDKYLLAAQWLKDGLSGRKIDFPQNSFELRSFKFARSRATLGLFSAACFVHLTLPFLYAQMCPYEMATSGVKVDFKARLFASYPTVETLMAIEFLVCMVYFIELASRLLVNNLKNIKEKRLRYDMKDKWTTVRLVCVCAIFIELLAAFFNSSTYPYRFSFALIPVVYISRRKNLRNMLQGMFIAMTQTYSIMLLLVLTIAIWGYSGFLLFRNFDSGDKNRFENILESFLTCLRVFASRTFSVLAINTYYEHSHASSIFFVSLTIGADLLAGSLLIAVGTRAYRNFANQVYTRQMKKRRYAMCAIHKLLSKGGFLQLSDWLGMSAKVKGRYHLSRQSAKALFIYECASANDVCLDIRHFFRLVGLATGNIIINIDEDNETFILRETDTQIKAQTAIIISDKYKLNDTKPAARDSLSFIKVVGNESISTTDDLLSGDRTTRSDYVSEGEMDEEESNTKHQNPLDDSGNGNMRDSVSSEHKQQQLFVKHMSGRFKEDLSGNLEFITSDGRIRSRDSTDGGEKHSVKLCTEKDDPEETKKTRADSISDLRAYDSEAKVGKWGVISKYKRWFRHKFNKFLAMHYLVCNAIVSYEAAVAFLKFRFQVNLFETFYHIARVLLAVELTYLTQYESSVHVAIAFSATLESLFWMEMFIRMGSFHSLGAYFRITAKRIQVFINVSSLLLGLSCGFSFTDTNPVSICYIIIQILRFFRAYHFLDGFYTYEAMLPVFANVGFLMFAVIYFFSAFAHNRFCSAMEPENVVDANDDSAAWGDFENQLNFNTFAQSLYTLFQVAVIGSWNMVASTAAKKFPIASFLFFYSYRLFMTLTVMPILFSFIIQIYIIRRDLEEQGKRPPAPVEESGDRNTLSMVGRDESMAPSSSAQPSESTDVSQSRRSVADDVSSFVNSMAAQHPELGIRHNPSQAGDSTGESSSNASSHSSKLKSLRRSRMMTHISSGAADKETEMMGTMWSSDPMLLKRRPVELLENENRVLKQHLAIALRLLQEQKIEVETQELMAQELKEFIEGGLEPKESEINQTDV